MVSLQIIDLKECQVSESASSSCEYEGGENSIRKNFSVVSRQLSTLPTHRWDGAAPEPIVHVPRT